jgi:hypothetical protein
MPCNERFEALFPSVGDHGLELVGRMRIDLPQYRFRGLCKMLYAPEEGLRIDFHHSSLFGAVREDVTVLVGDSMIIYDRGQGRLMSKESSREIVDRGIGERIEPRDVLYALLLVVPPCTELGRRSMSESGSRWELRARWRDRDIVIRGERGKGPREFEQCFIADARCLVLQYDSYAPVGGKHYPRRIRLDKEHSNERIDFELSGIREVTVDPSVFDPAQLGAPFGATDGSRRPVGERNFLAR